MRFWGLLAIAFFVYFYFKDKTPSTTIYGTTTASTVTPSTNPVDSILTAARVSRTSRRTQ